jgi:carbon storage regulator
LKMVRLMKAILMTQRKIEAEVSLFLPSQTGKRLKRHRTYPRDQVNLLPLKKWIARGKSMLVLTRRAGESIMIDNEVELKVLKIRGSQVHLGIEAPKKSTVHRKEVWLRIHGEPQAAPAVKGSL